MLRFNEGYRSDDAERKMESWRTCLSRRFKLWVDRKENKF